MRSGTWRRGAAAEGRCADDDVPAPFRPAVDSQTFAAGRRHTLSSCASRLAIQHSNGIPEIPLCARAADRKSTRLNSSHRCISYAVFCLKKKKKKKKTQKQ